MAASFFSKLMPQRETPTTICIGYKLLHLCLLGYLGNIR